MSAANRLEAVPGGSPDAPLGILTKQFGGEADPYQAARAFPLRFKLQREAQKLLPAKRVSICNRHVKEHPWGEVVGRCINGKAEFINVLRCGSVWDCPVCAGKISSSRSQIVLKGMHFARSQGYQVDLLTLTVPHTIHQPAKAVIASLTAARTHLKQSEAYRSWKKAAGHLGEIWATEVTYGANGWHPHCHALVFTKKRGLEALREQWTHSVVKQGLGKPNRHGFRVSIDREDKDGAAEYVSKWGLEHELTRSDLKKSRFGGRTPFQLLKLSMEGDEQAGKAFIEYSEAFHGRPQLLWTNGLKAALLVEDQSDSDLAEAPEIDPDKPHEIFTLDQASWMLILGLNLRGEILYYAAKYGQAGVDALLAKVKGLDYIDEPYYTQRQGGVR
jgi:hypothetical protein